MYLIKLLNDESDVSNVVTLYETQFQGPFYDIKKSVTMIHTYPCKDTTFVSDEPTFDRMFFLTVGGILKFTICNNMMNFLLCSRLIQCNKIFIEELN